MQIRTLCYQLACAEITNLLNPACNYPPGVFDSSANGSTGSQVSSLLDNQSQASQQYQRQARQLSMLERRELAKRCINLAVGLMSSSSTSSLSSDSSSSSSWGSMENMKVFHEFLYGTLRELGEDDLLVNCDEVEPLFDCVYRSKICFPTSDEQS
jgi:hypothetical protein